MHVPSNGQGKRTFQTSTLKFPLRRWVKLTIGLHFGLYAPPSLSSGVVYNDDLVIQEGASR